MNETGHLSEGSLIVISFWQIVNFCFSVFPPSHTNLLKTAKNFAGIRPFPLTLPAENGMFIL